MSEEESNENANNEGEENEDEEKEEGDGEENEDEEKEEDEEGEEKEEDEGEEGEEKEDDEGEEGEEGDEEEDEDDEEGGKKKKKGKKKGEADEEKKDDEEKKENGADTQNKFPETKLSPTKEIKMDLNLNLNNSDNLFFNGNEVTLVNFIPKKSTLQLLMEISMDMDALTSHLEKVLPPPIRYNIDYKIDNYKYNYVTNIPSISMPIIQNYSLPPVPNYDQEDLEIRKLISKANEMTNNSILNKNSNIEVNRNTNTNERKILEDKGCQSDEEMENSYQKQNDDNDYNENNVNGRRRFPYDPNKHLEYYNDLRHNRDENRYNFRRRRMDDFYGTDNFRRHTGKFSESDIYYNKYNYKNNGNEKNFRTEYNDRGDKYNDFQRHRPGNINQAMDILLDKK